MINLYELLQKITIYELMNEYMIDLFYIECKINRPHHLKTNKKR